MNAAPKTKHPVDPREQARAEALAKLRGFRGALADLSPAERAALAAECETEQCGSVDEIKDTP